LNSKKFDITAIDSKKVLDLYKKDFQKYKIKTKSYNAQTTKIPFKTSTFDCILSWRVLHRGLRKYRHALIKDLKRILRKKGFLIVAVAMDKDIEKDKKRRKNNKEIEKKHF